MFVLKMPTKSLHRLNIDEICMTHGFLAGLLRPLVLSFYTVSSLLETLQETFFSQDFINIYAGGYLRSSKVPFTEIGLAIFFSVSPAKNVKGYLEYLHRVS